jgi:hypothetical protein
LRLSTHTDEQSKKHLLFFASAMAYQAMTMPLSRVKVATLSLDAAERHGSLESAMTGLEMTSKRQ